MSWTQLHFFIELRHLSLGIEFSQNEQSMRIKFRWRTKNRYRREWLDFGEERPSSLLLKLQTWIGKWFDGYAVAGQLWSKSRKNRCFVWSTDRHGSQTHIFHCLVGIKRLFKCRSLRRVGICSIFSLHEHQCRFQDDPTSDVSEYYRWNVIKMWSLNRKIPSFGSQSLYTYNFPYLTAFCRDWKSQIYVIPGTQNIITARPLFVYKL